MGITERKLRERTAMKKLILDAAHELYSEKGLDFTTIRKIAEKIDYSPTTIYLYYPSKDLILYDMQKLAFESLLSRIRLVDADQDAFGKLYNLGKIYIDFGIQNPEKYDLMFLLHSPMNAIKFNQPWGNFQHTFRFMRYVVNECINEKSVIYKDPLIGSLQFWGFLHGITSLYLRDRLVDFCGTEQQESNPVYQVWNGYVQSIHVAAGHRRESANYNL